MMRRAARLILLLAAADAVPSAIAAALPDQPSCAAAARYSADHRGVSFVVLKDGALVCEDYPGGGNADTAYPLASGTKSFSGLIAAAAVQDGFLSLDEPVAATIGEWRADRAEAAITIRQLIGLVSGIEGGPNAAPPAYAQAIRGALVARPGTRFIYGPVPFQVFGELMRRKLLARGAPGDPLAYLTRRVFDPLGVRPASWAHDVDGNPTMPSGARFSARMWARVGELMRNGGAWQGRQLVDRATLAELTRSGPVNPSYGISWWVEGRAGAAGDQGPFDLTRHAAELPAGIYAAVGAGQQRLYVIPSAHLVVVRQTERTADDRRRARLRAARGIDMATRVADPDGGNPTGWSDAAFLKLVLDGQARVMTTAPRR